MERCFRIGSIGRFIKGKIPGRRNQGRPRMRWLDGIQETLSRHRVKTTKMLVRSG